MSKKIAGGAPPEQDTLVVRGVVLCFVLSGFAALLYQTAWMRQFSFVFGTSELAVAAVLSAYMAGLALGSALAARFVERITRPVLVYGLLEAGIALSALAVPWMLRFTGALYAGAFGGQPEPVDASGLGQSFFYLAMAFVILSIPTTFMGATLPLLTKYVVRSQAQIGRRVGLLYASNTLGAIIGVVVAGYLLLPTFGLNGTVLSGVAVNFLVFVVAALIARNIGVLRPLSQANDFSGLEAERDAPTVPRNTWILPLMLVSGANSFIYEVLWTRLLGHVLGGSITAFATMLAGFLGGIAIGSAVAANFANSQKEAARWFIGVQTGIAVTSILIYQFLPFVIPGTPQPGGNIVLAIIVLLPATIFIGATFPLAVRMLAVSTRDAASASARVYAWNTVGAIAGATIAAFFLIPALKYEGAIKFAVLLNLALALAAASLSGKQHRKWAIGISLVLLATASFYRPGMPEEILRSSPVFAARGGDIAFYEVGRSATVIVVEQDGYLNLRTNGLPEASTNMRGAPPDLHNQRLLATVPALARPNIESMLIIGLGAGAALEGVPASVRFVDVIELEPEVIAANKAIADQRAIDPLQDARFNLIINDARSALALTTKRYDAIVSQPSHPWTAGASHLYTREFMQMAKDHLAEGGVFLQWMNTQFLDEFLLQSLCATLLEVFPYVRVYQWQQEELFFLGSDRPLNVEAGIVNSGRPLADDVLGYLEKGVGSVEDVVTALTMDQENVVAFAAGGRLITDNNNSMATMSAKVMGSNRALRGRRLDKLLARFDPLLQEGSAIRAELPVKLNFPYISRRMERMGMKQRAIDLANSLVSEGDPQSLIMIALGQQWQGEQAESQKNLVLALQADPQNQQARYALLQPWFEDILRNAPLPVQVAEELPELAGSGAATLRGWLAANRDDMRELVRLDAALASVLPSDLWYELSVMLRAEWRSRLTTPEYQPRMANEATKLIDSAIAFFPNQEFHLMRLESTYLADDVLASMETARRLVYIIGAEVAKFEDGTFALDLPTIETRLKQLRRVDQLLLDLTNDTRVPGYKRKIVEQGAAALTQRLLALRESNAPITRQVIE